MVAIVADSTSEHLISTRTGRKLEVREYGDPSGHPVIFFHGLIGSHYQASYIAEQATQHELRIIAPNRPGVGRSEFVWRQSVLEAVPDIEDLTAALHVDQFSVIGISGGTPYAAGLSTSAGFTHPDDHRDQRHGTDALPGALHGMDRQRRLALELGSRYSKLARQESRCWGERFRAHPQAFLKRLVETWPAADQKVFEREEIFDLFLLDLRQVFIDGNGPETFAQELRLYRNYGFSLADLPGDRHVTLWQGLDDIIVPPAMAWKMAQTLPHCEAHLVPGGHFVAITISDQIIARLSSTSRARQDRRSPRDQANRVERIHASRLLLASFRGHLLSFGEDLEIARQYLFRAVEKWPGVGIGERRVFPQDLGVSVVRRADDHRHADRLAVDLKINEILLALEADRA